MRGPFSGSIRRSLIVLVLLSFVPALGITLYTGFSGRVQALQRVEADLVASVEQISQTQERITDSTRQLMELVSSLPVAAQGRYAEVSELLASVVKANPIYSNLVFADANGDVLASGLPAIPANYSDREEFRQALRTGSFSPGGYNLGKLSGVPVFSFAMPVPGRSGETGAVLIAGLNLERYGSYFDLRHFPVGSILGITDAQGVRVLFHPAAPATNPLGGHIRSEVWQAIVEGGDTGIVRQQGSDGVKRIYAFKRVRIAPGQPPYLNIVLGIPESQALQPSEATIRISLVLLAVYALLGLAIAWTIGNRTIAAKVSRLVEVSRRYARGELDARSGLTERDGELGTLGKAFEDMAAAISRDMAARREAERALQLSEEKFRSIVESTPTAMHFYTLTQEGRLLLTGANPAARALAPSALDELIGKPLEEVLPGLSGTDLPESIVLAALDGHAVPPFDRTFSGGGIVGAFEVRAFRTGPRAIALSFFDLSQRNRLQEMLIQSEKMLSLGGLASGMAHEINNPLGGILQNVQVIERRLLQDSPANTEAAEAAGCPLETVRQFLRDREIPNFLEAIRESGGRAARVVGSMLEFSRADATEKKPAAANALMDNALDLCMAEGTIGGTLLEAGGHPGPAILREYAQGLPEVPCNAVQIEQVLVSLIRNAAQALRRGGPPQGGTITLRTALEGDMVRLDVADDGPGIPEGMLHRIFEPFFTTNPPGMGTGLGLSMSYFIVAASHGGKLNVVSAPGGGATFSVLLPLQVASASPVRWFSRQRG